MRVVAFVAGLKPMEYQFYVELAKTRCGVQLAAQYRTWWQQNGTVTDEGFELYLSTLEGSGVPTYILAALDNDRLHALLVNYTLIVHEEVVRVTSRE